MHSAISEVFANCGAGERCKELLGVRVRSGGEDDARILHRASLGKKLNDSGHVGLLLAACHVDAEHRRATGFVGLLLVQNRVDTNLGLARTAVANNEFALAADIPPFDAKASVKMTTDEKEKMELLPSLFDIRYRLNGDPYYLQNFELSKGKGSFKEYQPDFWHFDAGDEIEYSICAGGQGNIPTFTEISVKFDYKFPKLKLQ